MLIFTVSGVIIAGFMDLSSVILNEDLYPGKSMNEICSSIDLSFHWLPWSSKATNSLPV